MFRLLNAGRQREGDLFPAGIQDIPGARRLDTEDVQEQHRIHSRSLLFITQIVLLLVYGLDRLISS